MSSDARLGNARNSNGVVTISEKHFESQFGDVLEFVAFSVQRRAHALNGRPPTPST
jgi:hypothetical protein